MLMFTFTRLPATAIHSAVPSDVWSQYQYDASNDATFRLPDWRLSWKVDIGGKANGGISVVGNNLYIESFAKKLFVIDIPTARILWSRDLSNVAMNAPIVVNGIVIVGTGVGSRGASTQWLVSVPGGDEIDAFRTSDGAAAWRYRTVGEDMATGVYLVAKDRSEFIFSNGDNHVYALDPATGRLLWRRDTLGENAMSDLAEQRGHVYGIALYSWQRLFDDEGLEERTPAGVWSWTWSLDASNAWFDWRAPYGIPDGGVVLGDGLLFLQDVQLVSPKGVDALRRSHEVGWEKLLDEATWSTHVVALDARTGSSVWSSVSTPNQRSSVASGTFSTAGAFLNHTLYEPLQIPRRIAAFRAYDGHVLWSTPTKGPVKMVPVILNGLLYAGDTDGNFYVVRTSDGSIVHTIAFPSRFSVCPPVIVGRTLFVVNGRFLYALPLDSLSRGIVAF